MLLYSAPKKKKKIQLTTDVERNQKQVLWDSVPFAVLLRVRGTCSQVHYTMHMVLIILNVNYSSFSWEATIYLHTRITIVEENSHWFWICAYTCS